MAFTYSVKKQTVFGDMKVVMGTFDGDSVTTGELDMSKYISGKIFGINLTADNHKTTPVVQATIPTVNEALPLDSATPLTLVFENGAKGLFKVFGEGDRLRGN